MDKRKIPVPWYKKVIKTHPVYDDNGKPLKGGIVKDAFWESPKYGIDVKKLSTRKY